MTKDEKRLYDIEYRKEHRPRISKYQRDYLRNLRRSMVDALGGKCIRCGFEDIRALQIDHINGGGSEERRDKKYRGASLHKIVLESFLRGENKYQLLCANCNWIKREENQELYK